MRSRFPFPAWRAFRIDNGGSVPIMTAAFLVVAIGAAALAVDVGSIYVERRALQGTADLAAMIAAGDIDNAEAAVAATLKANSVEAEFHVERGQYKPDLKVAAATRFTPGNVSPNAVRVRLSKPGNLYFAQALSRGPIDVAVSATAAASAVATFSVGSRLLAVRGGVINKVLGKLLGSEISLSVMDYEALAQADITLGNFLDALTSEVNVRAGTYSDVLTSHATIGNVIDAVAAVTEKNGDAVATAVLKAMLGRGRDASPRVPLTSFFDLGPLAMLRLGDTAPGLDAKFSAMDLVFGAAILANGRHQVEVDLGAEVPGLLGLRLEVAIGEPPQHASWAAVGLPRSIIRTAQTRLKLIAEVGGGGVLAGIRLRLPLYIDLAYAEARLQSVTCASRSTPIANVAARPGVAEAWIGEVAMSAFDDFADKPTVWRANIVDTRLLEVRGKAHIDIGNVEETTLSFDQTDVDNGEIKRTDTRDFARSVVTTLLEDLKLDVRALGLGIALPGQITSAAATALAPVAQPLDEVVHTILSTLGVHLGEADVRVHGMTCGSGVLAG